MRVFAVEDQKWQEELDAQRKSTAFKNRSVSMYESFRTRSMVDAETLRALAIQQLLAEANIADRNGNGTVAREKRAQVKKMQLE